MKKYMTLLTSLCLTVLAFAGNDFLVKRFEESIGPGNEGRVKHSAGLLMLLQLTTKRMWFSSA